MTDYMVTLVSGHLQERVIYIEITPFGSGTDRDWQWV